MSGSTGSQLTYGQLGGGSRVHVQDDGVHVTDSAGTERVLVRRLTATGGEDGVSTYGLRVVASDGATVIIDGGVQREPTARAAPPWGTFRGRLSLTIPAIAPHMRPYEWIDGSSTVGE